MNIGTNVKDNIKRVTWTLIDKDQENYTFIGLNNTKLEMNELSIKAFDFAMENELYSIIE